MSLYHLQERGYCFGIQFSRNISETNLAYIHDFLDDIIETSVSQESGELKHGATFPEKLIEPLIKVGSMVGDTVLDPFCGTGTTGKVSLSNGRKSIGYEVNPSFNEIIKQKMIDFSIDELSLTGS